MTRITPAVYGSPRRALAQPRAIQRITAVKRGHTETLILFQLPLCDLLRIRSTGFLSEQQRRRMQDSQRSFSFNFAALRACGGRSGPAHVKFGEVVIVQPFWCLIIRFKKSVVDSAFYHKFPLCAQSAGLANR
ncbi:hypothetical protein NDU88_006414 [Pleurodeles waltl]|uniref:Uncharacterized protein n=1 Tax=Pleurodeles waltl TaxID=8319 RepID=A0AAV7QNW2_PLEWA|nr:hypothetical protein NDU88_006414 [Pleurodeles waltl]